MNTNDAAADAFRGLLAYLPKNETKDPPALQF
jgi:hypothetical protein